MRLISHRGNLTGPRSNLENQPSYVSNAIIQGFDVEIDFWLDSNRLYLGHDSPIYEIKASFLDAYCDNLWIHCKNLKALEYLHDSNFNYFWQQQDDFSLTSQGYIWTYPEKQVVGQSVIVCLNKKNTKKIIEEKVAYGICSDYVGVY